MGEETALVVPLQLLGGEPAHALNEATLNLAAIDGFVDGIADIMKDVHPQETMHPGEPIDFDLSNSRPIGEIMKWMTPAGVTVPVNARGAVEASRREAGAFEVGFF